MEDRGLRKTRDYCHRGQHIWIAALLVEIAMIVWIAYRIGSGAGIRWILIVSLIGSIVAAMACALTAVEFAQKKVLANILLQGSVMKITFHEDGRTVVEPVKNGEESSESSERMHGKNNPQ